ncbi:porin family protein [Pontibacter actiniarum]|uniref:Outer membrane protein beta-barrel domain-containing protein n=1 Tax=Pontibacter actiniarum TaxID=323450 RepID=A0A1X9YNH5_9BACT|nr:porin family protein [Pontibacter actiniarum]ARS34448.1 hypothetical protein CA264_02760 [Pontibacter actiniarum]
MKSKFLLTVAAALGLTFAAEAQTVTIGPRVGVNIATQRLGGDASDDDKEAVSELLKYNTGAQFGAVVNVGIDDMFSLQPELLYVQKGYKVNAFDFEDDFFSEESAPDVKVKYSYLEVPILAKVTVGEGPLKGFATAGPTLGYLMSGKVKADEETEDLEVGEGFNRFELGASVGVGLSYNVGPGALNLDVRYGHGFSGIIEDDTDGNLKNRGFGISLAYLFGVK